MGGIYKDLIARDGALDDYVVVTGRLDTDATLYATLEQMHGMIWYLADALVGSSTGYSTESEDQARYREEVKAAVEEALGMFPRGLQLAKEING